jgi:hypothetical protein
MLTENALSYGMVAHHYPEVLDFLKRMIDLRMITAENFAVNSMLDYEMRLRGVPFSWRRNLEGAARYILENTTVLEVGGVAYPVEIDDSLPVGTVRIGNVTVINIGHKATPPQE